MHRAHEMKTASHAALQCELGFPQLAKPFDRIPCEVKRKFNLMILKGPAHAKIKLFPVSLCVFLVIHPHATYVWLLLAIQHVHTHTQLPLGLCHTHICTHGCTHSPIQECLCTSLSTVSHRQGAQGKREPGSEPSLQVI